ncbi:hypothetical protein LTR17_022580 [Elasticomyces elasticus]|nr:hypothetical protein LTR17_022580 [Elasticomyces elasticus]
MTTPDPRESIRTRITAAIEPWIKAKEEPPFSCTQLVVMALVMSDTPLTRREVWSWIVETFAYYREIAAEALWNCTSEEPYAEFNSIISRLAGREPEKAPCRRAPAAAALRQMLDEVYQHYELPLLITTVEGATKSDVQYTISPLMGERWLDLPVNSTVEADNKVFRFFELPAELREVIYKMAFQYPISGLRVPGINYAPEVLSRDLDDTKDWSAMPEYTLRETLPTQPISKILSPLLVSRQFYNETMPVFFNINTFFYPSQDGMNYGIIKMPTEYRKHLRSISFEIGSLAASVEGCDLAFVALKLLPNLRVLEVYINRRDWRFPRRQRLAPDWAHLWACLSGVQFMRKMRGLDRVDCAGCPALQELLQDMCKPKSLADGAAA